MSRKDFQLLTPFVFNPDKGKPIEVLAHPNRYAETTDLASVPPLLWGLLPSYGRQLRAAILHDFLCDKVNAKVATDRNQAYKDRRRADDVFHEAMRDKGDSSHEDKLKRVGGFRSRLFWAGVCFGTYWKFRKPQAVFLTAQVVVGALAGLLALGLLIGWIVHLVTRWISDLPVTRWLSDLPVTGWLSDLLPWDVLLQGWRPAAIWAGCALLSFVWGRRWLVSVIGLIMGPLVVPVFFITFIAQMVMGVPDFVVSRLRDDQPLANFGPTVDQLRRLNLSKTLDQSQTLALARKNLDGLEALGWTLTEGKDDALILQPPRNA